MNKSNRGWFDRGYLPHRDEQGLLQAVTIHLNDSLPLEALKRIAEEVTLLEQPDRSRSYNRQVQSLLDHGYGSCLLANENMAEFLESVMIAGHIMERFVLHEWVIMPNHVHAIIETHQKYSLSSIMHAWKSMSARFAQQELGHVGRLWIPETYDRYIRDATHFNSTRDYIFENPVKAGLSKNPQDWPFGSARLL